MNPVLLTGATGFIGQRLQKSLLNNGRRVTALVRPGSKHSHHLQKECTAVVADLHDHPALKSVISGSSAVIYCAGSVRGRKLNDFRAANIEGVRFIVEAMNQAASDTPLLLISSLAASRPEVSDYANSKHLGEQEVIEHATFPWSIFRPPAVYGPGDREMLPILKLARKGWVTAPGPRDQKLSLIYVDDVASAVLAWLESWSMCQGEVFTLDDGHEGGYDWQEIAEIAARGSYRRLHIPGWLLTAVAQFNLASSQLLGYAPMLTPGKARELTQRNWVCNNRALTSATGWMPETSLEQGLTLLFETPGDVH